MTHPMTLRRLLLLTLLTLAGAVPALAQSQSDGSIYSRFGVGELFAPGSSQVRAMGGEGAALYSLNYVNFANPATWSDQVLTRGTIGFTYQGLAITDAQDNTSRLTQSGLGAVGFSFPIVDRRLGVGLGFSPFSRVGYRVRQEGLLEDPLDGDTTAYLIDYEGSGGIQQLSGGLGYRIGAVVSVGANVDVLFGIIENGRRTSFLDNGFAQANLTNATRVRGVTATLGGLVALPRVAGEEDALNLAVALRLPTSLDGEHTLTVGESLDRDTLAAPVDGSLELPWSLRLGASYRPNEYFVLNAGGLYEPWSAFSTDLDLPPADADAYRDRIRLGAGFEYTPAGDDLVAGYFERTAFRLGASYDRAYVSPVPGQSLRTLSVTGGLSLPTLLPGTRLDVNLEVGTRGTTDRDLVQDTFYRLGLTLNVGERWFLKQKLQ